MKNENKSKNEITSRTTSSMLREKVKLYNHQSKKTNLVPTMKHYASNR